MMARPLAGSLFALALLAAGAAGSRLAPGWPRPFDHARHEAVIGCTRCHGTGEQHGAVLVKTPRQCAGCHHDATQERPCTACHSVDAQAEPVAVRRTFTSGVFTTPQLRTLPFAHVRHRGMDCRDCHDTPVTLAPGRACASCHAAHHRASAECASCHPAPAPAVHTAAVHLSCGGAACHAPGLIPDIAVSRTVCLACHPQQRAHERGVACASCHLLTQEPAQ